MGRWLVCSRLGEPPWVLQYSQLASCQSGSITAYPSQIAEWQLAESVCDGLQMLTPVTFACGSGASHYRIDGAFSVPAPRQPVIEPAEKWILTPASRLPQVTLALQQAPSKGH